MKYLLLFISYLVVLGANPPFNPGANPTTSGGSGGSIDNIGGTNTGIKYISRPAGNNALNDMLTNTPTFAGQLGVSQNGNNTDLYLWAAKAASLGSNGWGTPIYIPSWGGFGAQFPYQSPLGNVNSPEIKINGNPGFADRTNALNDASLVYRNYNPYGHAMLYFPMYTTNIAYNYFGSGGYTAAYTNLAGEPIVPFDNFGLTIGSIQPNWVAGITNQAGSGNIILGGNGSAWPFHISDNQNLNAVEGSTWQHPYFTIDRRGLTNGGNLGVGFPILVPQTVEPTQANWAWGLVHDPRTGKVFITNNLTTVSNILSKSTNAGANVFGGNYDSTTVNNFNGSSSFNVENTPYGNYGAYTFDAASTHRLGFQVQSGFYPKLVVGLNAPLQFARSSVSDLQTSQSTALISNLMVFDVNGSVYLSNVTSFASPALTITNMNNTNAVALRVSATGIPNAFIVQSNGNVGIGTATPTNALNVVGALTVEGSQTNAGVIRANGSLQGAGIIVNGNATSDTIQFASGSGPSFQSVSGTELNLSGNGFSAITAMQYGRRSSNDHAIVFGNTPPKYYFREGLKGSNVMVGVGRLVITNNYIPETNLNLLEIYMPFSSTLAAVVNPAGFVGIGTANPLQTLHVTNGVIRTDGGIGSYATNAVLTIGTTGVTNTLSVNAVAYEFAGVSVIHKRQNGNTFSRGTISAGIDIVLKPGESLTGTSCSSSTNLIAW